MSTNIGDFVVPGEIIKDIKSAKGVTIMGPGLRRDDEALNTLCVCQAGILCFRAPNTYWIDGRRNRYVPKKGDLVVGVVVKKMGDALRVDIGSAEFASLSLFAFEGATKKQKPDVTVGDVVYAKLLNAHREMEPELVCVDSYFKAGTLGILSNDGFLVSLNSRLIERLLNVENPLLRTLGKKFPFEICIGLNGKVWLNAYKSENISTILRAFQAIENQDDKSVVELCRKYK